MNIRRRHPPDSLYMLLDTMCNAFGGIILLAVLVTLLSSKERQARGDVATDSRDMVQRRLAVGQTNLQESQRLLAVLQAKASDNRWRKQVALLSTRTELQALLQQIREAVANSSREVDTAGAFDPSDRLKLLKSRLAEAQVQKVKAQNGLAAAEQNKNRLQQRRTDLERQVADRIEASQRQLRLPKEYTTGKRVLYIIARYGSIYPCRHADFSRNEGSIHWSSSLTAEIAEPIRGKGIDPAAQPGELPRYFKSLQNDLVYVAFCVYEDSFTAFNYAKQVAVSCGVAYGWEPFRSQDGAVVFSETGQRPKPQ